MLVQLGIGGAEDGSQQLKLGYGRIKCRQHEVADAQQAQTSHGSRGIVCAENEEEDLDDVVVALEVAQRWVLAEDFEDDMGELVLPTIELLLGFCRPSAGCCARVPRRI